MILYFTNFLNGDVFYASKDQTSDQNQLEKYTGRGRKESWCDPVLIVHVY